MQEEIIQTRVKMKEMTWMMNKEIRSVIEEVSLW
jgi:hypothetical protein